MPKTEFVRRGPGHFVLTIDGVGHDLTMPIGGNIEQIVIQTLGGQEYAPLRLPGWQPRLVVDVGANVGASAIFFALSYPGVQIRCFEPSAETSKHLRANTAWLPGIEVHEVGLFNRHAEVPLYAGVTQCAQASVSASIETNAAVHETIRLVPARAVLGNIDGPAILKIDTEGCEVPILHDLGGLVEQFDVVYVEWHSERDRRQIDSQLGPRFNMWRSKGTGVHRGTAAYVHQRVIDAHPRLGMLEIPAISLEENLAATA